MYFNDVRVHFYIVTFSLLIRKFELLLISQYYLFFGLIQQNMHVVIISHLHLAKEAAVLVVRLVAY